MTAATNYLEQRTLDFWLKANSQTTSAPSTVYIGLHTADPGETGSLTNELSGNNYSRQSASFGAVSTVGNTVTCSTNADITFGPASASWGTITHVSVHDASTSGNTLFYGALSASKTVGTNDSFKITSGNLTIELD